MNTYMCIDIGGTAIKYGVMDASLNLLEQGERPTESKEKGGAGIVEKIFELTESFSSHYALKGVAISTAGMVDPDEGRIIFANELIPNYTGTPLKQLVEQRFGLPCEVENDVNCAGLSECTVGAGRGADSGLCLTIGTGIGGCLILSGDIYHGHSNSASNIGYMHLGDATFQERGAASILVKKVAACRGISENAIDGKQIFDEAEAGSPDCIKAIDELVAVLAQGIANAVYLINPEVVILGGGIMARRDYLEPRLKAALKNYLIPAVYKNTRLAFAKNGNRAGMIGALINFLKKH